MVTVYFCPNIIIQISLLAIINLGKWTVNSNENLMLPLPTYLVLISSNYLISFTAANYKNEAL